MNDESARGLADHQRILVDDMVRVVARDRWGLALMVVGWAHLAFFLGCQGLHEIGDHAETHYIGLWVLELVAVFAIMRGVAGRGWAHKTPLAGLVLKVWITFLILSFSVVTLNALMGRSTEWFKPVWATLSSFGFMTMAYLFGARFFLLAVQMYFTALLMALNPDLTFLIYGVSWWAALQAVGLVLVRDRARLIEAGDLPQTETRAEGSATWKRSAQG